LQAGELERLQAGVGAKDSPLGFWFTAICHFGIFAFGLALALYAVGLIGDPTFPIRIQLPRFV